MNTTPRKPAPSKAYGKILLLLALIASPLLCCSGSALLAVFDIDTGLNFFQGKAVVSNNTPDTVTLTPITTTYGEPRVIGQSGSIRQKEFPVGPGESVTLEYDAADAPLAGIVVCKEGECRLLPRQSIDTYQIDSFESLPPLEPGWLEAVDTQPEFSLAIVFMTLLGLVPLSLFAAWIFLGRKVKTGS